MCAGFAVHSTGPSAAAAPPAFEAALDEFLSAASTPVEPGTEPDETIVDIQNLSASLEALMDPAPAPAVSQSHDQQVGTEANSAACPAQIMCHAPTPASWYQLACQQKAAFKAFDGEGGLDE